jgi:hypothetical protein
VDQERNEYEDTSEQRESEGKKQRIKHKALLDQRDIRINDIIEYCQMERTDEKRDFDATQRYTTDSPGLRTSIVGGGVSGGTGIRKRMGTR